MGNMRPKASLITDGCGGDKRRFRMLGVCILFGVIFYASGEEYSRERFDECFKAWRRELVDNWRTMGLNGIRSDCLDAMGPNVLPELFEEFEKETDENIKYLYYNNLLRVAKVELYFFSKENHAPRMVNWYGPELKDDGNSPVPLLSVCSDASGKATTDEKDAYRRLLQWWVERGSFLRRSDDKIALDAIREARGARGEYDWPDIRQIQKHIKPYGIYAIPTLIEYGVTMDDSLAYYLLVRIGQLPSTFEEGERIRSRLEAAQCMDRKFPDKMTRVQIVSDWWAEKKHTFTRLEDLYAAIDTAVKEAEASIEAEGGPEPAAAADAEAATPATEAENDTFMSAPSDADAANKPVQTASPAETSSTKDQNGLKIAIALGIVFLVAAVVFRIRRKPDRPAS